MARINLLPWREQARQEAKTDFIISTAAAVVLTLFMTILLHFYLAGLVHHQQYRNDYLQNEMIQEQGTFAALKRKKAQLQMINEKINFIFSLRQKSYATVQALDELVRLVPEGVVLDAISQEGPTITLIGNSQSNLQVTLFMKSLGQSLVFKDPILTEITTAKSTASELKIFKLTIQLQGK